MQNSFLCLPMDPIENDVFLLTNSINGTPLLKHASIKVHNKVFSYGPGGVSQLTAVSKILIKL